MRTWLHGIRTGNTSVILPISRRLVSFILLQPSLETDIGQQMSTCSGLAALDHANTKYTKGYATSGIVCITCQHEFVLPEGAGPLQKGEQLVFNSISSAYN